MSKKIIIVSAIILILTSIVLVNNVIAEDNNLGKNYKIAGVVKKQDGTPVINSVLNINGQEVVTDSNGNFEFTNLQQGKYILNINNGQYQVDSITRSADKKYSLNKGTSICFLYPGDNQEIRAVIDEIANKLRYINSINTFKIKIYEIPYTEGEDLETASKKVMQDNKNVKLIVAFAKNAEFIERCKEKQDDLGVQPNISISTPYKIICNYIGGTIQSENVLYNNFFEPYNGGLEKKALLEKIFNSYNNNIRQTSREDEVVNINFTENDGYAQTEEIEIKNDHDNDSTNSINIVLKERQENENSNNNNNNSGGDSDENSDENTTITTNPETGETEITITPPTPTPPETGGTVTEVDVPEVKFSIQKKVTAVKLVLSNGTELINEKVEGNPNFWSIGDNLKIIELDEELMHGATIHIEYEMAITNTSDERVIFTNVSFLDCFNYGYENNFVYNPNNQLLTEPEKTNEYYNWQVNDIGNKRCVKYATRTGNEENLTKGKTITKKIILSRVIAVEDDEMYYENYMILENLEYNYEYTYKYRDTLTGEEKTRKETATVTSPESIINKIENESSFNGITKGIDKSETIIIIPPTGR